MTVIITENERKLSDFELNQNFWEELDSLDKFYYLGMLITDGYVTDGGYVGMDLGVRDLTWLKNFKANLNLPANIRIRNLRPRRNSTTCSVTQGSKQWVTDLAQYGIMPRKTGKEYLPLEHCDTEQEVAALMLGVFDGDFGISQGKGNASFTMCGSKRLMEQSNAVFEEYAGVSPNKISVNSQGTLHSSKHGASADLKKLHEFLYQNKKLSSCWMPRKAAKFQAVLN